MPVEQAIRPNLMICRNPRRAHYHLLNTNRTTAKLKCNAWSLIEILETASCLAFPSFPILRQESTENSSQSKKSILRQSDLECAL